MRVDDREIYYPFPLRIRGMLWVVGCRVMLRRRGWIIVAIRGIRDRREHRMMHFGCCRG
jgi:hypothetical protein